MSRGRKSNDALFKRLWVVLAIATLLLVVDRAVSGTFAEVVGLVGQFLLLAAVIIGLGRAFGPSTASSESAAEPEEQPKPKPKGVQQ